MFRFLSPTRLLLMVVFVNVVCWGQAPAQQAPGSSFDLAASTDDRGALEKQTYSLVNQYRRNNKLPSLQWDEGIARVARDHSRDMASGEVDFGHDGFGGRVNQLKTVMIGLKGAGENVLKTDDPDLVAQRAVAVWLGSPHHLRNIRGDYNYSGMGVWWDKKGVVYFTQIFVKLVPQVKATQSQPPYVAAPFDLLATPGTR